MDESLNYNTDKPNSQITEDFGRVLKNLRTEKKLTQHDLTDRSGLSLRMISDMERGIRQPSLITLYKLARGLDMPVLEFMERIVRSSNNK